MAATSDDDVQDGDTTAAGIAPATSSADDEEDRTVQQPPDPKIRNAIANAGPANGPTGAPRGPSPRAPVAVPSASKPAASPPLNVTSKKMTVVGLAPPQSASVTKPGPASVTKPGVSPISVTKPNVVIPAKPAAKPPPTPTIGANEADEDDASITATAPAPRVPAATAASAGVKPPPLPLSVPGPVLIREMPTDDEPLDETEVRTVVSGPPPDNPPPVPAQKLEPEDDDEELEDSVTTQAPSAVKGGRLPEDEPRTSPPLRMPPPIPAAGRSPFDQPPIPSKPDNDDETGADDAYNAEESVTTRGPAVPDFRLPGEDHAPESSGRWPSPVTPGKLPATMSQALGLPPAGMPPPIEDGTEGTTNRGFTANKGKGPPRPNVTQPSALMQPPVIGGAPDILDDDDLHEDNRTAVMIGAPVKPNPNPPPAARMARAGGMATQASAVHAQAITADKSSSESGLRIAPHEQQTPPQPASLGAMMAGALAANNQANQQRDYPSQPLPHLGQQQIPYFPASEPNLPLAQTIPANSPHLRALQQALPPGQQQQSPMQQFDFASTIKKPRYGLLVGLVALLSFAIPLVLFLWLHQSVQEPFFRTPAEVASDHVGLAAPSGQRLAPPPSASSSAHKPGKPPGGRH